jgi:hypothetical protein
LSEPLLDALLPYPQLLVPQPAAVALNSATAAHVELFKLGLAIGERGTPRCKPLDVRLADKAELKPVCSEGLLTPY